MECSQETMELLEGVLGDAISKQKNRASYAHNASKFNNGLNKWSKYQLKVLNDIGENGDPHDSKHFDKLVNQFEKIEKPRMKRDIAANKLNDLGDSDWVESKSDKLADKRDHKLSKIVKKYSPKWEAAQILIEALDTLLSE